ncbi:hypothetical protein SAMN05878276_0739 [Aquipseudomonas alcaligenes]|uniref:hypothetical protein n=1 Tax=Aquipseudomonas alcaligenes TaxID=43263 RepID=UPI00095496F1|nr:hypothetical protein [Pseudomonas alcaligenes]SIR86778.1 hypothetical protein SAMN05878276_0739 [Pseudomonas alcaligenes]
MSGLFVRLAAQATGQRGTTLHSPARLPYQSLPERLQPTPEFATAPPSLADRQPPQEPTDPSQRVAPAAPTRHVPSGLFREQAEKVSQEEWIAPLPPLTNRPGVTLRAERAGVLGRASEKHAEIHSPAAPAALLPPQSPDDLSTPASLDQVPVELPLQPVAQPSLPPANGSEVGAVPERTLDKLVLPLPLLPATPRGAAPAPAAAASASALALPAREPDEVHIHIGRIEVTAIQESRPASKPSRKGAAPLSLDDYLARRKGDGS